MESTDLLQEVDQFVSRLEWYFSDIVIVVAAIAAGLIITWAIRSTVRRMFSDRSHFVRALVRQTRIPMRLASVLLSLLIVLPAVSLPLNWVNGIQHVMASMLVLLIGWSAILIVNYLTERTARRYSTDDEEDLQARKTLTQVRVLRQTLFVLITMLTGSIILLSFDGVRQYGAGLFASAGVAGLVVGLAARPVLANLFAGVQIALTQPIRINDVVIVENEWGWIEEITATYVVVRIWDWRRLVVPLTYFIETPFQNWTRDSTNVIGSVMWRVDYTAPIDEIRERMEGFVRESSYWDGKVVNLQVTDSASDVVELRGLMSARTSPRLWELRCEVREKLLTWLQNAHPHALPRARATFELRGETAGPVPAAAE